MENDCVMYELPHEIHDYDDVGLTQELRKVKACICAIYDLLWMHCVAR